MSFFYDLNKKLDGIRATPEVTHQQLNERDMSRAAKGYEKYGKEGMEKLAQAGREGKALDPIRKKYDKYDNKEVDEGVMDTVKSVGKKVAGGINKLVGHGSDEDMIKDLQRKSGAPVTGKKPTFADKIANAKKEVDEMLGDVAAEAIKTALSPKQKKIDMNKNGKLDANDFAMLRKGAKPEMDEERSKGTAFDMSTPRAAAPKVGSIERGHKHDIKHTATGRMVTRRVDDQGNSVGADDDSAASGEKRGRGRPKGTKQSIGAKGPSGKSKLMTKEGDVDVTDQGEYDQEGDMAKDDIKTIVRHAQALSKVLGDDDNLPEWVQSKLAKIEGMMISIDEYMQNQEGDDDSEEPIAEKAVSKQQQKFMGMAHAMQKGDKIKGASKELKKVAKTMKPKDTEDFAKTKHKGLPDKVKSKKKEEDVEESTTSAAPKSGGGMSFGKGIYDSMNRELEQMIAESMSINMSDSTEGGKSLTVTATDEDAMKLAMMLKSAGIGGQGADMHSHGEEPCATCGMPDCGCGDVQEAVDENSPDWPTNTETSDDALQYAGGLNKPKTDVAGDGQTTIPNTAVHTQDEDALRRMMEMAGMSQNNQLDEGIMDKLKSFAVPKLMKLLGPDAEKIASAVKQATGGDLTPSKENAMKVVQALGIGGSAAQGQSQQMAEGIAGNWQGKLMQALYTLGLLGSAGAAASMWGTVGGSSMAVIGTLLLMFAGAAFGNEPGQVGAMGNFGNKGTSTQAGLDVRGNPVRNPNVSEYDDLSRMMEMAGLAEAAKPDFLDMDKDGDKEESMKKAVDDKEEDTVDESIQRMREMAGIKEAKKDVDEEKTEEGNLFTGNLAKARADGKKEADLDGDGDMEKVRESIFSLTNQWKTYKG